MVSSSHHPFCSSSSSRALTICPGPMCVRLPTRAAVAPCGTSVLLHGFASLRPTIRIVRALRVPLSAVPLTVGATVARSIS